MPPSTVEANIDSSSIGIINTNVIRNNDGGTARDANVVAITANLNFFNNSHFFNGAFGRSSIFNTEDDYSGGAIGWELGKQVGAWRWAHNLELISPDIDTNDLGFQRRGNKFHQSFETCVRLLEVRHIGHEPRKSERDFIIEVFGKHVWLNYSVAVEHF